MSECVCVCVSERASVHRLHLGVGTSPSHSHSCAFLGGQKWLTSLQVLNVDSNPVASTESYRSQLFDLIPSLMYIDDEDRCATASMDNRI